MVISKEQQLKLLAAEKNEAEQKKNVAVQMQIYREAQLLTKTIKNEIVKALLAETKDGK